MNDRVESIGSHAVAEQIHKTVARENTLAVEHDCQSGIQICVVPQQGLDICIAIFKVAVQAVIRCEGYICSVLVAGLFGGIAYEYAFLEFGNTYHTFAVTAYLKIGTCGIYSL